jgi:hypothetical protein
MNFTMKDIPGHQLRRPTSAYHHDSSNVTSNRMKESGIFVSNGDVTDGDVENMSLIIGNLAGPRQHHRLRDCDNIKPVTQDQRDACLRGWPYDLPWSGHPPTVRSPPTFISTW